MNLHRSLSHLAGYESKISRREIDLIDLTSLSWWGNFLRNYLWVIVSGPLKCLTFLVFFGQVCTQVLKFYHNNWKGGVHFPFPFLVKLRFATAILGLISVFFLPFRFATAILGLISVFLLAFWFVSAILALISV